MSEYKRLTKRADDYVFDNCCNCEYDDNPMGCTDRVCYEVMKNRLAELEDKMEQGTLIELKYPLHKAVYFLRNGAVEEGVIVSFNYNRYTNPKMWYSIEYYIPALKSYYVEVVKEDIIYPTREEAEKKLEELKNGSAL